MEIQAEQRRNPTEVPPYEEWPSVPTETLKPSIDDGQTPIMEIDDIKSSDERDSKHTSELSMDDLEAAHALEGLRSGLRLRIIA